MHIGDKNIMKNKGIITTKFNNGYLFREAKRHVLGRQ